MNEAVELAIIFMTSLVNSVTVQSPIMFLFGLAIVLIITNTIFHYVTPPQRRKS